MSKGLVCLTVTFFILATASIIATAEVIDLVFVIDASGSISDAELALEIGGFRNAVNNLLLPAINAGTTISIGVICFSTDVRTLLSLTPLNTGTVATINAAIDNAATCDRALTNIGDALSEAITVLAGGTAPRQVINLVSNGEPTTGPDPVPIADSFKATLGNEIWTVGVDVTADGRTLLQALAGPPPAGYFEATNFADFGRAESEKISEVLPPAPPAVEICDNGIDDDGDSLIDCDDPDCAGDPACRPPGAEICDNGIDDDGDGLIDCDDPDCAGDPACRLPVHIPTLSQWGMIILSMLFVATSIAWITKRKKLLNAKG